MTAGAREPVGVGVIGAGNFARRVHLPNLVRITECRLRAVCDLDAGVAGAARERFGAVYDTTDYRQVLADPAIAIVVIALRDDLQAPAAVAALDAGKHVYVEKPLAETPEACEAVIEARQRSGLRLAVGFNRRYAPVYAKAREFVAADGGPFNVNIRMADDAWRWAKGYPPGYLIQHDVCHLFDLVRWLSGSEIESVYCVSSRSDDDSMTLRLRSGCVVAITQSGHGTMDMPKERLEVVTRRGGVRAEDFVELRTYGYPGAPHVLRFAGQTGPNCVLPVDSLYATFGAEGLAMVRRAAWEARQKLATDDGGAAGDLDPDLRRFAESTVPNFTRNQGWLSALQAFVRGVADGTPTEHAGAEDALAAARAAQAAVRSRSSGEVIRL